ncbi:MAG TPA: hypothetical protein VG755_32020 [Nannocystaceae bacterium]|nr:hypothetical protein [Nannocystaceae bacterium]
MRRWWIASSLLSGCTALNPLFGEGAQASGQQGSSEGDGSGRTTDDSGSASGTSVGSSAGSSKGSEVGSETGLFTSGASSESGHSCALPEVVDVAIDVTPPPAADPTCGSVYMSLQGPLTVGSGTIDVADCTCMCPNEIGPAATIAIDGIEIPPLPQCGYVMAWQVASDAGCEWAGVAVFSSSAPDWIISRTPFVPPSVFGGLDVALNRKDACESSTCDGAGVYELEFTGASGDSQITMDEAPKRIELPFNAALPYLVDDVSSVLDEECVSHLVWTAELDT